MTVKNSCCCLHVKTCGKIVSILGILGSLFLLASLFLLFHWIPLVEGILLFISYCGVLYGVIKERPHFFYVAQIVLGINIVICVGLLITFIVFEFIIHFNAFGFALLGILIIALAYTVFAWIVIHRSKKFVAHHSRSHC
jgi:hypothetical protein